MRSILTLFFAFSLTAGTAQSKFDLYVRAAVENLEKNDVKGAIKELGNALGEQKNVSDLYKIASTYVSRGSLKMDLQQYDGALKDFRSAQKLVPEYSRAYFMESTSWFIQKNYTNALTAVNKCIKLTPSNFEFVQQKCNILEGDFKFENSIAVIDSFMVVNGESMAGLTIKARNFFNLKKYVESRDMYTRVLELNPKNTEAMFNRALSKGELKDYKGVEEDNLLAASIDTAQAWVAYNNIGFFVNINQGDWAGGIISFNKAIAKNPNIAFLYSNRGWCKFNLKDEKGGRSDVKKSLEIDPTNAYAYKYLAQMNIAQGLLKDACVNLRKAEELNYTILYDNEVKELMEKYCK